MGEEPGQILGNTAVITTYFNLLRLMFFSITNTDVTLQTFLETIFSIFPYFLYFPQEVMHLTSSGFGVHIQS